MTDEPTRPDLTGRIALTYADGRVAAYHVDELGRLRDEGCRLVFVDGRLGHGHADAVGLPPNNGIEEATRGGHFAGPPVDADCPHCGGSGDGPEPAGGGRACPRC